MSGNAPLRGRRTRLDRLRDDVAWRRKDSLCGKAFLNVQIKLAFAEDLLALADAVEEALDCDDFGEARLRLAAALHRVAYASAP